jgi:hypothetical protein
MLVNKLGTEHRHLLKVHEEILTVHEVINELYKEYEELGYRMNIILPNSFSYYLDDASIIIVYWEKGRIYEDVAVVGKEASKHLNYNN